jgi:hypothetical protein
VKTLAAVGLVVVVAIVALFWQGSDRRRIEKALDRLERACEKDGPDSAMELLGRNQTIVRSFAPGFLALAEPYGGSFTSAQELASAIHAYRASARKVRIGDSERRLEVEDDGTAEMELVFHVSGETGVGGAGGEAFRAQLFWVEHEGDWKIREFRVVEVVERGGLF